MKRRLHRIGWFALGLMLMAGCRVDPAQAPPEKLQVPPGYVNQLQVEVDDRVLSFGPFVGYYFKPLSANDLERLDFICFNERSFYTRGLPANARLFEGKARWQRLPDAQMPVPGRNGRIVPVFFSEAPGAWLQSRPEPHSDYVHFHSAYDGRGAVRYGYWLKHVALAEFTYDMGGRVTQDSPLYHEVAIRAGQEVCTNHRIRPRSRQLSMEGGTYATDQ